MVCKREERKETVWIFPQFNVLCDGSLSRPASNAMNGILWLTSTNWTTTITIQLINMTIVKNTVIYGKADAVVFSFCLGVFRDVGAAHLSRLVVKVLQLAGRL